MRQVTRKGLTIVAAAGGVLALGGYAHAATGAGADGAAINSPGIASGNSVQAPVNAPVNVCGNTVDAVGALNPAFGNKCVNESGGAQADGPAADSPGIASGNSVQAPVNAPVNVCGNSVNAGGALNPSFGNACTIDAEPEGSGTPDKPVPPSERPEPGAPSKPSPSPQGGTAPQGGNVPEDDTAPQGGNAPESGVTPQGGTATQEGAQLAETGASALGLLAPAGAAALLGGTILYRRARRTA
ncbi:DUF320 domain-containing protein [Streptomyces somaliensis]|uniref:chaplin family protein n=1 Tax=Streptomyces somaliensis TaxID=78355 RepID=UPI0020CD1033|nr:chaplin family protein [Streptomyces somaliensis]MCP9946382.1 DUF320 domain-containing protein [Streptomyces somaliensis]MCP9960466.1 DUF320 domain-containing protein [Streptomyces somaliensis]MCP9973237.1 DUF320 domain-containing protein [Streptomyces somaliensis]